MTTLHITNGDSAGDTLRSFVSGDVSITADPLHEGPARAVDGDEWRRMRAQVLVVDPSDAAAVEETVRWLTSWDTAIERAPEYDEVVLWFEHDLFDQLQLMRTIDLMSRGPRAPRVSLICIGAFPGVERFVGLGQLMADQLASLDGTGRPVTDRHYEIAREVWTAFRAPDPTELFRSMGRLKADPTYEFLPDALRRFFEEYPSSTNGLSRTATAILQALGDGPLSGGQLFVRTQAVEARPFMGDLTFYGVAQRLASARVPLILVDGSNPAEVGDAAFSLTAAGRDVAAGHEDAVALNGIDEWRGGVHLHGTARSPWRWDAGRETLLS